MNLSISQIRALISNPLTVGLVNNFLPVKNLNLINFETFPIKDFSSLHNAAVDAMISVVDNFEPVKSYKTKDTEDTCAFDIHIYGVNGCYVFYVDEVGIDENAFDTLEEAEYSIISTYGQFLNSEIDESAIHLYIKSLHDKNK